ncbi:lactonase family protein [Terriglobus roseus]|uniref:6-phosphogluconolactonase n=1 Tax=Terriglobus roseus TaxID=392734 RepID=A0A1H4MLY8_9BACT|nr:lactonase family protein [Terriglobus roseus]SEB83362.1 6-phosphogluconolactonase [Terriglobus roseus]
MSHERIFLGTSGNDGRGVYTATFDTQTGTLTEPVLSAELPKASFLCFDGRNESRLLAISQTPGAPAGEVACFHIDVAEAKLTEVHRASTQGTGAVHVSAQGGTVVVANYVGGSAASFHMDADGTLHPASFFQFNAADHGPDTKRQDHAYAHAADITLDGGYVLINDLGLDRIHVFKLDAETAKMTPHGEWLSAPGAGPRHIALHPNGKWIYNIDEMGCTINQLAWDAIAGTLTTLQTIETLPPGASKVDVRACDLVFSKDLRFLYAANRVHEDFVVFSLDAATGALTEAHRHANPGKEARHIAIDPSGKWFLSANQFSNEVSVFPIDTATGKLGDRSSSAPVNNPSCLLFG